MKRIDSYEKDGYKITEYYNNDKLTHTVKEMISDFVIDDTIVPTNEDRIKKIEETTAYTQLQVEYLTILAEIK